MYIIVINDMHVTISLIEKYTTIEKYMYIIGGVTDFKKSCSNMYLSLRLNKILDKKMS